MASPEDLYNICIDFCLGGGGGTAYTVETVVKLPKKVNKNFKIAIFFEKQLRW